MRYAFMFLALTALMLSSCNLYKEVEVREVLQVQVLEFSGDGAECAIELKLFNPNGYKITLTESEVDLFFEGKYLGHVQLKDHLVIPRKSESVVQMKCLADYESLQGIFGNIITLLFKTEFSMEGKGFVKGRALAFTKKFPVEFKEKLSREDLGF